MRQHCVSLFGWCLTSFKTMVRSETSERQSALFEHTTFLQHIASHGVPWVDAQVLVVLVVQHESRHGTSGFYYFVWHYGWYAIGGFFEATQSLLFHQRLPKRRWVKFRRQIKSTNHSAVLNCALKQLTPFGLEKVLLNHHEGQTLREGQPKSRAQFQGIVALLDHYQLGEILGEGRDMFSKPIRQQKRHNWCLDCFLNLTC